MFTWKNHGWLAHRNMSCCVFSFCPMREPQQFYFLMTPPEFCSHLYDLLHPLFSQELPVPAVQREEALYLCQELLGQPDLSSVLFQHSWENGRSLGKWQLSSQAQQSMAVRGQVPKRGLQNFPQLLSLLFILWESNWYQSLLFLFLFFFTPNCFDLLERVEYSCPQFVNFFF